MTAAERLVELKARLAKAQADCNAWRAAGDEENYLQASCRVEALEMQLGKLEPVERTSRKTLNITYNGKSYEYGGRQYERFTDAVDQARADFAAGAGKPKSPR